MTSAEVETGAVVEAESGTLSLIGEDACSVAVAKIEVAVGADDVSAASADVLRVDSSVVTILTGAEVAPLNMSPSLLEGPKDGCCVGLEGADVSERVWVTAVAESSSVAIADAVVSMASMVTVAVTKTTAVGAKVKTVGSLMVMTVASGSVMLP